MPRACAWVSTNKRSEILKTWANLIKQNLSDFAVLLSSEQGKPLKEAENEITDSISTIEWSAEQTKRLYGVITPSLSKNNCGLIMQQPIGVVGAITPWNYPCGTITHKIAPALAAGCTIVLKPSKETPYSALALADLAKQAKMPAGVLNITTTTHTDLIGKELTQNPLIRKFTFTGSTATGKLFMRQSADTIKKLSLELGGNAPFIVFDDADLKQAITDGIIRKFTNCGQICISPNRFLIQENIYANFIEQFANAMKSVKIGSLINDHAKEKINKLIQDAVNDGAKIITGGKANCRSILITDVTPDMAISQQEIFGPVAAIQKFTTEQQAIKLANDTNYGLAAYFYTKDLSRIFRLSEELEYGVVFANTIKGTSMATPFGGFKQSGIGREGGQHALEEFCETKHVALGV